MWPCVCNLPCLIFLCMFFHSSVTMTAGWEGVCVHAVVTESLWRADFMSSKCKRGDYVCGCWQLWAMHFASQRTLQVPWLTAFKKCIVLKLRRDMCLHHLNSATYTDRSLCYFSAFAFIIALLSCFLVSLCSGQYTVLNQLSYVFVAKWCRKNGKVQAVIVNGAPVNGCLYRYTV